MPPKYRDFKPKSKSKTSIPQSENDFLDTAEEFEQAGGKWRAGDAAKAARFFQRAIQVYDQGLQTFPRSFDLAYNKAHLEYQSCEDDRIVAHLGDRIALLHETLASHRAAFALNGENLDIQFNTGQVLVSLGEALLDAGTDPAAKASAQTFLEEAAEVFTQCLAAQQRQYEQMRLELANVQEEQSSMSRDTADPIKNKIAEADVQEENMDTSDSPATTEWATVEEALTPEVILETCTAQLDTLVTLIGLYDPADLAAFEKRVEDGLRTVNTSIPTLISLIDNAAPPETEDKPAGPTLSISSPSDDEEPASTPQDDAILATIIFQVAIAEFSYRSGQVTVPQYANTISTLFSPLTITPQSPTQQAALINAQSAYADALVDFASAVSDTSPDASAFSALEPQWEAFSQAQSLLTQLCTPPTNALVSASRLADMFVARGDADLARYHLSLLGEAKPSWRSSKMVLIGNAGIFYRGGRTYAEKAKKQEVAKTAGAKAVIAEVLKEANEANEAGNSSGIFAKASWRKQAAEVERVLEHMVSEKTMSETDREGILKIVLN
ncbi:hypothetical protein N0V90_013335 [Kalmusia sp. IMI 367209]|nr:hypothetical protein N0V90_013335 [Kalmusia sp. IMI 367209]